MDQLDGARFAPRVLLRELFRLTNPRTVKDAIDGQIDAGQNLSDLVNSVRFIPGTGLRQPLRNIFTLAFLQIVLKDFPKIIFKVFPVEIVIELITQKAFERLKSSRSDQARFQAAPAQDLPFQGHHIFYEHLIDNIDWLYGCIHAAVKLVIGGGVFSFEN